MEPKHEISISSPTLLDNLTYSPIVFTLVLAKHPSSFRICRRIWIWIAKQWLHTQNNSGLKQQGRDGERDSRISGIHVKCINTTVSWQDTYYLGLEPRTLDLEESPISYENGKSYLQLFSPRPNFYMVCVCKHTRSMLSNLINDLCTDIKRKGLIPSHE